MRWDRELAVVDAHVGGEIGRMVFDALPPSLDAVAAYDLMRTDYPAWVELLMRHPRGHPEMSVNIIVPPAAPGGAFGLVVLQDDGPHAFSGSNAMCAVTAMLETGRLKAPPGLVELLIETAVGTVAAQARWDGLRVEEVTLGMPPAFAVSLATPLRVADGGLVEADIAFGGAFYALVDGRALGVKVASAAPDALVALAEPLLTAARAQVPVRHPDCAGLDQIEYVMICDPFEPNSASSAATVLPPGRVDRSPCGTGTCARLAALHARGVLVRDAPLRHRSITGAEFIARAAPSIRGDPPGSVRPMLSGRAFLHATSTIGVVAGDPTVPQS